MADARESSGLHSLAELRRLAADETRKQAESAQRARLTAERKRAQIEQERADQECARRAAAESGLSAEIDRLERARQAESEQARSEAHARRELELTLIEERSQRRKLELDYSVGLSRSRAKTMIFALVSGIGALLALAGYFGAVRPAAASARRELVAARAELTYAKMDAEANVVHARAREASLTERVNELERALVEARTARTPSIDSGGRARDPSRRPPSPPKVSSGLPCHDDGDPLNPCLRR